MQSFAEALGGFYIQLRVKLYTEPPYTKPSYAETSYAELYIELHAKFS
jgi:hypothetical protein